MSNKEHKQIIQVFTNFDYISYIYNILKKTYKKAKRIELETLNDDYIVIYLEIPCEYVNQYVDSIDTTVEVHYSSSRNQYEIAVCIEVFPDAYKWSRPVILDYLKANMKRPLIVSRAGGDTLCSLYATLGTADVFVHQFYQLLKNIKKIKNSKLYTR